MINENNDQTVSQSQPTTSEAPARARKPRGFAAMDPKLVSELAKRGGKAAHRAGTAHQFTSDEARVAGRKGGMATHAKRRVSNPAN
jgi:general stress protein YciG